MTDTTDIRKIINTFINDVDNNKQYTLKQLDKKLETSYTTYIPNISSGKKAPTAYNIYIKEKMAELKANNSALTAKELMKMAASGWTEYKQKLPNLPKQSVPVAPPVPVAQPVVHPSSPEPEIQHDNPTTPEEVKIELPEIPKAPKKKMPNTKTNKK